MSFLVIGRDQDPAMPWLVSELADIYPVLETVDEFVVEANQASIAVDGQRMPPHPIAFARGAAALLALMNPRPREITRRGCTCKKKAPSLVKAYALDDGIWVWIKGYRLPKASKRHTSELHEADELWPLRRLLSMASVTYCPLCGRYWGVPLSPAGYQFVRLGTPRFDVKIPH